MILYMYGGNNMSKYRTRIKRYEFYKGQKLIATGTLEEIADKLKISTNNVKRYGSKAYKETLAKHKNACNSSILIEIIPEEVEYKEVDVKKHYAMYKGDIFIDLGTLDYLESKTGLKKTTLQYLSSRAYEERLRNRETQHAKILIKLEDEVDEYAIRYEKEHGMQ